MVHSIGGRLPVGPGDDGQDVPLVYYNPSNGERTEIGTAHVSPSGEFTAELDDDYTYFFSPRSISRDYSFYAPVSEVKCEPRPARPKER